MGTERYRHIDEKKKAIVDLLGLEESPLAKDVKAHVEQLKIHHAGHRLTIEKMYERLDDIIATIRASGPQPHPIIAKVARHAPEYLPDAMGIVRDIETGSLKDHHAHAINIASKAEKYGFLGIKTVVKLLKRASSDPTFRALLPKISETLEKIKDPYLAKAYIHIVNSAIDGPIHHIGGPVILEAIHSKSGSTLETTIRRLSALNQSLQRMPEKELKKLLEKEVMVTFNGIKIRVPLKDHIIQAVSNPEEFPWNVIRRAVRRY